MSLPLATLGVSACHGGVVRENRRDSEGRAITEPFGRRISDCRSLIDRWHFSRDLLTAEEYQM